MKRMPGNASVNNSQFLRNRANGLRLATMPVMDLHPFRYCHAQVQMIDFTIQAKGKPVEPLKVEITPILADFGPSSQN
jgi:hypothetical protein